MLAALVDDRGQVQVPGFYDDVDAADRRASASELAALPFDEAEFMQQIGVDGARAAKRATRRSSAAGRGPRSTSTACASGYQGEGAKTVLPATAGAKFSFRLVPNQDPEKITAGAAKRSSRELCPPGIKMELIDYHGAPGVVVPLDSPYVAAAERAIEARLRPPAGLHARRRLDSHRRDLPRAAGSRYAAAGLGPGRRQHAQPQRKVLAWPISTAASRPARSCGRSWDSSRTI